MLIVGFDNVLHQLVTDHVALVEVDEFDPLDVAQNLPHLDGAGTRSGGRSTWVISPVTTTFEWNPSRVRNIFICSAVAFCASSRMTNKSSTCGLA